MVEYHLGGMAGSDGSRSLRACALFSRSQSGETERNREYGQGHGVVDVPGRCQEVPWNSQIRKLQCLPLQAPQYAPNTGTVSLKHYVVHVAPTQTDRMADTNFSRRGCLPDGIRLGTIVVEMQVYHPYVGRLYSAGSTVCTLDLNTRLERLRTFNALSQLQTMS